MRSKNTDNRNLRFHVQMKTKNVHPSQAWLLGAGWGFSDSAWRGREGGTKSPCPAGNGNPTCLHVLAGGPPQVCEKCLQTVPECSRDSTPNSDPCLWTPLGRWRAAGAATGGGGARLGHGSAPGGPADPQTRVPRCLTTSRRTGVHVLANT